MTETTPVLEGNDPTKPVGKLTIDPDAIGLDEKPEDMALVPAYDLESGKVYHWSLVPVVDVITKRTADLDAEDN